MTNVNNAGLECELRPGKILIVRETFVVVRRTCVQALWRVVEE